MKGQHPHYSNCKYYLCDYQYGGEKWSIEIPATSWDEAEARLQRLAHGKVVGEIRAAIPFKLGFLAKLLVWFKGESR